MDLPKIDKAPAVATVMTTFPYTVGTATPLAEAQLLMRQHDIGQLPVHEGDEIVGMVTDRQLERLLAAAADADEAPTLRNVALKRPYVVDLHTSLAVVAAEMARRQDNVALVVRGGRLAGIFTATDACRILSELFRAPEPSDGEDIA
jgi:CBS domain-containing protein